MNSLPPLVVIHLYREALRDVERVTRQTRDKKLHAWATRSLKESQELLIERAKDEMDEDETEEEQKRKDADFYGTPDIGM